MTDRNRPHSRRFRACAWLGAALAVAPAPPAAAISFGRADLNNDGVVTSREAYRSMDRMSAVHVDKCDRDGDGAIDRSEFPCLVGLYDALYRHRSR